MDQRLGGNTKSWRCCGGRMIFGPDRMPFTASLVLVLVGNVHFAARIIPLIFVHWPLAVSIVFTVLWTCLFCLEWFSLLKCGLMDPGILPRNPTVNSSIPSNVKEVKIRETVVFSKYCDTCGIWRPPRSSHCAICNNCVENFDHHCPWVGNCVGRRNYKHFVTFLITTALNGLIVLGLHITLLVIHWKSQPKETAFNYMASHYFDIPIAAFLILSAVWSVGGLAGYHLYLAAIAQTTNEEMKQSYKTLKSPFAHNSFVKNIFYCLCGPNRPSFISLGLHQGWLTDDFVTSTGQNLV